MGALLLNPTVIVGILLALSLAGNGVLYKLHTNDLQQIGALKQAVKESRADAEACSEGVKKLRAAAAAREKTVVKALHEAEARARLANERSDHILQERPVSADVCDSALELNQRKLKERRR